MAIMVIPRLLSGDYSAHRALVTLGLACIFGLILGTALTVYNIVKTPKMTVTVSDDEVDVVKGKAHGTYPIEDFVRGQRDVRAAGRSTKVVFVLVFEGEEDYLYIDLPGFTYENFRRMTDAIGVKKHELQTDAAEDSKETLNGDIYKGEYTYRSPIKFTPIIIFFAAVILFLWGAVIYLVSKSNDHSLGYLCVFLVIGTISAIGLFVSFPMVDRKIDSTVIKVLSIGTFELKVNEDVINLSDIERVYITQPYLTEIAYDQRKLIVTLKNSAGAKRYIVGDRPKTYSSDDEYIKLYNSIINLCNSQGIPVDMYDV